MSLPTKAIDRVFQRLAATYMAAWDRAMGVTPQANIKTVWAHELAGFGRTPEALRCIAWALENLPESPPNAIQFKRLCQQAPAQEVPRIESPPADPAHVAAELAKLAPLRNLPLAPAGINPHKAWAHRLKHRHDAGDKLSRYQIECYREALKEAA